MNSAVFDVLRKVTTATISTMLLKKGIRRCWMNGPLDDMRERTAALLRGMNNPIEG
jgi:hypothetical protein